MSIKKYLLFLILPLVIGLTYFRVGHKNSPTYLPMSKNFLRSSFSSKGIANRIINIQLNYNKVESDSEKVEVTANIHMPFDFNGQLHYRWKLSQGVSLLNGPLTGEISGLEKNQVKQIYLDVNGFSKSINRQIGFEVFAIKDGKTIYGDALIASDLENTFEDIVQNVEKIKASEQ